MGASSEAEAWVDTTSIAPRGKYRKAWILWNFNTAKKTSAYPARDYLSSKVLNYYDCTERTSGSVQSSYYAELSGLGDNVGADVVDVTRAQFRDVIPETVGEALWEYVCKGGSGNSQKGKK